MSRLRTFIVRRATSFIDKAGTRFATLLTDDDDLGAITADKRSTAEICARQLFPCSPLSKLYLDEAITDDELQRAARLQHARQNLKRELEYQFRLVMKCEK